MKSKTNQDLSIEQLAGKRKTLLTILMIVTTLIVLYLVYFISKLIAGTWQVNNALGMTGIGGLVIASSILSIQLSMVNQEIKRRS